MRSRHDGLLLWIGAFKLVKAGLLLGLGVAGLLGMAREVAQTVVRPVTWLGGFPGRDTLLSGAGRLWLLDHRTAEKWGLFSLAYAAVFFVEGAGLLSGKRWAEWLTVGVTSSFVPVELYELVVHFSAGKVIALVLNIAIVAYLIVRRVQQRQGFGRRIARTLSA